VNVLVTNGFINRGPLLALLPFIGAMNIDVKGFTEKFYGNISGKLDAVKNTVELAHKHCHVEVTTLIIPDENDGGDEITELCKWLASVNDAIPLHLTRFYPRYKYGHKPPTDIEVIIKLRNIAEKYLKNIFI
jgi:pyruvate formate lyase activating enzyme